MTIKAVIYDMDGVLVDSEVYWFNARVQMAESLGKRWTDDDQRHAMGRSTTGWAQEMQTRLALDWSLDEIITETKRRVIAQYEEKMPARPGALESVHALAKQYRVALASGSPTDIIQSVMTLTGLDRVFEVVVYGDSIPRGKPHPDIYLAACERLGVSPTEAVGIEDSPSGIRSVRAAGMRCIAAPSPAFPLTEDIRAFADVEITSMEDLTVGLVSSLEGK